VLSDANEEHAREEVVTSHHGERRSSVW
jgi:hypothetical protein